MLLIYILIVPIYLQHVNCMRDLHTKFSKLFNYEIKNIPDEMIADLLNTQDLLMSNKEKYPPVLINPSASQRTIKNGEIPKYAIDFAPIVKLHSREKYNPYDINLFIRHFNLHKDRMVYPLETNLQLSTIHKLPNNHELYMTAIDEFSNDPDWLLGTKPDSKGLSDPATLIVVDKGNGWVDAYWFYFYSFNLGPKIFTVGLNSREPIRGMGPIGNHLGDWEHSLVRFHNGKPILVWLSAHSGGSGAYYDVIPKYNGGIQPLIYSAIGTHANYVTSGKQKRDPGGVLYDQTDSGSVWNPSMNYLSYTFDGNKTYIGKGNNDKNHLGREEKYGNWLYFSGYWGNRRLSTKDRRQREYLSKLYKYVDGPSGPLTKNLMRISPCPNGDSLQWWKYWARCNVK